MENLCLFMGADSYANFDGIITGHDESDRYTFAKVEGYLTALRLITAKDQFTFIGEILYLLHQICHKQSSLRKLLIAFIIFYTNTCLVISSLLLKA